MWILYIVPLALNLIIKSKECKTQIRIAKYVKEVLPNTTINVTPSNDPRSYRQCSDKILKLGFVPKKNVKIAIQEIIKEFKNNKLNTSETCFSVKWLKKSLN